MLVQLAGDPDDQALVGELVHDVERAKFAAIVRALLDKVVSPDMPLAFGPEPNAGFVDEPEASPFRLFRLLGAEPSRFWCSGLRIRHATRRRRSGQSLPGSPSIHVVERSFPLPDRDVLGAAVGIETSDPYLVETKWHVDKREMEREPVQLSVACQDIPDLRDAGPVAGIERQRVRQVPRPAPNRGLDRQHLGLPA